MIVLAPPKSDAPVWESWRWLATPDERVLWAILAGAALLAAWGAWPACRAAWSAWRGNP
ncbi:hypothetical protein [Enhygromyxa salina]|uniref:hypothetical protein n=1 Tax=Enhygromyxa salina TaxID=215803 RepID=UPI0012934033|nr:hypothetical protein [Enhygromyxa salina]